MHRGCPGHTARPLPTWAAAGGPGMSCKSSPLLTATPLIPGRMTTSRCATGQATVILMQAAGTAADPKSQGRFWPEPCSPDAAMQDQLFACRCQRCAKMGLSPCVSVLQ